MPAAKYIINPHKTRSKTHIYLSISAAFRKSINNDESAGIEVD